jgi:hypothetical protein
VAWITESGRPEPEFCWGNGPRDLMRDCALIRAGGMRSSLGEMSCLTASLVSGPVFFAP